jgi:hypothetical protein
MSATAPATMTTTTTAPVKAHWASDWVQRMTDAPGAALAKVPSSGGMSYGSAVKSVVADVGVGGAVSAALGAAHAKGMLTKPRLLAGWLVASGAGIAAAPHFPTLAGVARRSGAAFINALGFLTGFDLAGGEAGGTGPRKTDKIADAAKGFDAL